MLFFETVSFNRIFILLFCSAFTRFSEIFTQLVKRLILFSKMPSLIKASFHLNFWNRDSSLGVETQYGLDGRSSIPGGDKKFSSTSQRPDWLQGPPSLLFSGHRRLFLRGVHRPDRETDNTFPSRAEINNGGAIIPVPISNHGKVLNELNTGINFYLSLLLRKSKYQELLTRLQTYLHTLTHTHVAHSIDNATSE
jgi:hypothetical protein